MSESAVVPIRRPPVIITAVYGDQTREPLGSVYVEVPVYRHIESGESLWRRLQDRMLSMVVLDYPRAQLITNFTTDRQEQGGYVCATADLYGEVIYDE